jgi:Ribbon-helix-helix protein, copG family.
MNSSTVNISFNKNLLKQIDKIAKEESRSRSELIREAARLYIDRKSKWQTIFDYGKNRASKININENDIVAEIKKYRKENR